MIYCRIINCDVCVLCASVCSFRKPSNISALWLMCHDVKGKGDIRECSAASQKLLEAFNHYLNSSKLQKYNTGCTLTYIQAERDTVRNRCPNFLANSSQLALSRLCVLHGGVHAALANQDYSAEQCLDMAVSNPL